MLASLRLHLLRGAAGADVEQALRHALVQEILYARVARAVLVLALVAGARVRAHQGVAPLCRAAVHDVGALVADVVAARCRIGAGLRNAAGAAPRRNSVEVRLSVHIFALDRVNSQAYTQTQTSSSFCLVFSSVFLPLREPLL